MIVLGFFFFFFIQLHLLRASRNTTSYLSILYHSMNCKCCNIHTLQLLLFASEQLWQDDWLYLISIFFCPAWQEICFKVLLYLFFKRTDREAEWWCDHPERLNRHLLHNSCPPVLLWHNVFNFCLWHTLCCLRGATTCANVLRTHLSFMYIFI